jgi:hypothetical protein
MSTAYSGEGLPLRQMIDSTSFVSGSAEYLEVPFTTTIADLKKCEWIDVSDASQVSFFIVWETAPTGDVIVEQGNSFRTPDADAAVLDTITTTDKFFNWTSTELLQGKIRLRNDSNQSFQVRMQKKLRF